MKESIPASLRERVQDAYSLIRQLDEGVNPVKKVHLSIYQFEGRLMIDEAFPTQPPGDGPPADGPATYSAHDHDQWQVQIAQTHALRQEVAEVKETLNDMAQCNLRCFDAINQNFRTVHQNLRRIASAPIRTLAGRQGAGAAETVPAENGANNSVGNHAQAGPALSAELSARPNSLYDLWVEYDTGTGGRKPAREFTYHERGRVKNKYTRRKIVWDVMADLVRRGLIPQRACDRIYDVYGRSLSVTEIINRMRIDRQRGGHPNLRL
jgi:Transcriptional activator of glycolytic enzymes